ncbi:MAG TPA: ABC transporter permease [Flavobacteriales bacterium]
MNKIGLIIKREYLNKVTKKSFILMTFLGPLLFGGLIVGVIVMSLADNKSHQVLLVDPKGWIIEEEVVKPAQFGIQRNRFVDDAQMQFFFTTKEVNETAELKSGAYTMIVVLDSLTYADGKCQLFYESVPSMVAQSKVQGELENVLEKWRVKQKGIDYNAYQSIKQSVKFQMTNVNKPTEKEEVFQKAGVGFALAIIIYFFIFMYGVQVMRGVMEEKTNRIVEVIVSSVRPFQLMMGKVIGIGLVALTQFLMWIVLTGVIVSIGSFIYKDKLVSGAALVQQQGGITKGVPQPAVDELMDNQVINFFYDIPVADLLFSFIFFFIGGYLIYASLFAAIGAAVDQEADTQQFMMPVTLPLIFAYIVSVMMMNNPDGSIGTIFSIIPLTSPIVMMIKVAIGAPLWLRIVSMFVLVVSFIFFIWLAARIYRVGILMYGKKTTYKELWKWIRYSG